MEHKGRGHQGWALRLLGEIASRCDPPTFDQAEGHYRQAIALAEELGMRPLVAHCHLGLGKLYANAGRRDEARKAVSVAIDLYRSMDMRFWLEQAEAELKRLG